MDKPLYLCVCQYGHSRSVALCRVLHAKGQQAIAVGLGTAPYWLPFLSRDADKILILESQYRKHIPVEYREKVIDFHVGPDVWSNPYDKALYTLLEQMVKEKLGLWAINLTQS